MLPKEFGFSVFPNPFNSVVTLKITLPVSGELEVGVFDLVGREVDTVADGYYPVGDYDLVGMLRGLGKGILFGSLRACGVCPNPHVQVNQPSA